LAIEHHVNAFENGSHPAFPELFGYLITTDDMTNHAGISTSRVSRAKLTSDFTAFSMERIPTVTLSYPPRSLASAIRLSLEECESPASTACLMSSSLTRSESPSEHRRNLSPSRTGNGSLQTETS